MQKLMLIIRDGWGYRTETGNNAIALADTPFHDCITKTYPTSIIQASEEHVGLPEGETGNSEVGHSTIGLGRVTQQPLVQINNMIETGEFKNNEAILEAINKCLDNNSTLHIMGIIQNNNTHGSTDHMIEICKICEENGLTNFNLHVFTDGRDSPKTASLMEIDKLDKYVEKIVSISGRRYAMDRDKRWSKTQLAYDAVTGKCENRFNNIKEFITEGQKKNGDEYIDPGAHQDYEGITLKDNIIFTNFRTDRPRQLSQMILENNLVELGNFYTMTHYSDNIVKLGAKPIIAEVEFSGSIGQVVSEAGLTQLRISETEKYEHVTFFMNGKSDEQYKGEERILINSNREVETYDLDPDMSVEQITSELNDYCHKNKPDLVICNLTNADMVGHTGVLEATAKGCEAVDQALENIVTNNPEYEYLIFADHGNADDMGGDYATSHTLNPVQLTYIGDNKNVELLDGNLADIAPTALAIMGMEQPAEMTGKNLIKQI